MSALLESVPYHQPKLHEQVDGIVQRRLAHPEVVSLHLGPQLFQGEMSVDMVNGIEYGITLGSLSTLVLLQVGCQRLPCSLQYGIFHLILLWLF